MVDVASCPECGSRDVALVHAEGPDPGDQGELECSDCGNIEVVTRVDINKVFK